MGEREDRFWGVVADEKERKRRRVKCVSEGRVKKNNFFLLTFYKNKKNEV